MLKKNVLLYLSLVICSLAQAQSWQPTSGVTGGITRQLMNHQNQWYAATGNGLYTSSNGVDWNLVPTFERQSVNTIEANGNTILVGLYNGGVYRSTDNGASWTHTLTTAAHDIQYHDGCFYVGTDLDGVFVSCNDGVTWTNITGNLGGLIPQLASDENYIYVLSGANLYRGTGSSTWTDISGSLPKTGNVPVMNIAGKSDTLVMLQGIETYRSSDAGNSWTHLTTLSSGSAWYYPYSLRIIGSDLYVGFNQSYGLWKGKLNSNAYSNIPVNFNQGMAVWTIEVKGDSLWIGTTRGIYNTDASNINWKMADWGITNTSVNGFEAIGDTLYASTKTTVYSHNRHLYRSTDGGNTWHPTHPNFGATADVNAIGAHQNHLFAGVLATAYKGNSASQFNVIPVAFGTMVDFASVGNSIYMATYGKGIFESTDGGTTWDTINSPSPLLYFLQTDGTNLYAGAVNGLHYRDASGIWHYMSGNAVPYDPVAMTKVGNTLVVAFASGAYTQVMYTNDLGATWTAATGLSQYIYAADIIEHKGILYLASDQSAPHLNSVDEGVWISTDSGKTWTIFNTGLPPETSARSLFSHNGELYLGTYLQGVYKLNEAGLGYAERKKLTLGVYPNPATDFLRWNMDKGQVVLYSGAGIQVGQASASAGNMSVEHLSPGLYFLHWKTPDGSTYVEKIIKP